MPLLPGQRSLLVKVLGMTGSEYDGEALAAVRKAHGILSAAGATWDSVIVSAPAAYAPPPPPPDEDDIAETDAAIAWCLEHGGDVLTPWDRKFLVSLQSFTRYSEKQRTVLDRIVLKCQTSRRR